MQCILQGLTSVFLCVPSLLTEKSANLVVAYDGFLSITKIVGIFHSGYLDYRGTFQTILLCNEFKITDREGKWIPQFQTTTGERGTIRTFHSGYFDSDLLFEQFLTCAAV